MLTVFKCISLHPNPHAQEFSGSSPKRRRAEEKDEGIGSPDILEEEKVEDLRREMIELRQQLEKERSVRMMLEEQVMGHLAYSNSFSPNSVQISTPNLSLSQNEQILIINV